MGKYTLTRTFQKDRERASKGDSNTFTGSSDYFTEVPKDETQFRLQEFLYGFDPTGIYRGYINQRDLANYWNDYFRNTGLSWSDIRYPSMMRGYGMSGSYGSSLFSFSKNVARLYK